MRKELIINFRKILPGIMITLSILISGAGMVGSVEPKNTTRSSGTVSGYIYDQISGEPIENNTEVIIEGYDENGDYYSSYHYPDSDAYYIFYLQTGDYELKVSGYNYISKNEGIKLNEGEKIELDFHLEPVCSISGVVYNNETDEPISDIIVELLQYFIPSLWYRYGNYSTNEMGEYFFIMEPEEYWVRITEDGYKDSSEEFTVEEGDHIIYDIYLDVDYTVLSGYIYDQSSEEPIENASIMIYNNDRWYSTSVTSDENGYYEAYPESGESSITVVKDGYKDHYDTVTMEKDIPLKRNYHLKPYNSMIYGTVFDEDTSDTMESVYIQIEGKDFYDSTMSDENGEYHFYLDGGDYQITCSANEYSTYKNTITIESGVEYQLDIYLSPYDSKVFGYVSDEDGNYLFGAYVRISSNYYEDTDYTISDGYYEFIVPPSEESGEYTLQVSADGYREYEESFWLDQGQELQIDVELQEQWSPGSVFAWIWEIIFG